MALTKKIELGDFQTPRDLAEEVTRYLVSLGVSPEVILEPTCGKGAFVLAALSAFPAAKRIIGFDIQDRYISELENSIPPQKRSRISLGIRDFFTTNWSEELSSYPDNILVLGNPPWVTNSALGASGGINLPVKANFQRDKGFAAKTGKANFDISEWIIIQLLLAMQHHAGHLAMLCKTAAARKVLRFAWMNGVNISQCSLHTFNAQETFGVSVDACLFIFSVKDGEKEMFADLYEGFSSRAKISRIGIVNNELVANIESYYRFQILDGESYYTWRSGIKHDASLVMELTREGIGFRNGLHEPCLVEPQFVYPLLKSSDIANNRSTPKHFLLVTQKNPSDDTTLIQQTSPLMWKYLENHAAVLDGRKSIIYQKRPRFCIFGVGEYSFAPWKVAISGLYKNYQFLVLGCYEAKPIVLDDTCYSIPCQTKEEADFICGILNSDICRSFLNALAFQDAKRPITVDVLNRIDFYQLALLLNRKQDAEFFLHCAAEPRQALMLFESSSQKYDL